MSDADTGSTTQLSRSAAWRRWQMLSFDEPPPVEAAPEPEPDPGPDPEVVLAQLRAQAVAEGREEGYAQGHAAGHEAATPKGAKPVLPKAARPATPRGLPWPANRAPTRPPACTPWPNPALHRSARWKSAWARAC